MALKTQTIGGSIPYSHRQTHWVNGINYSDSTALGFSNRKWRNRTWHTQANWKALLASQGYLQTLDYTDQMERWEPSFGATEVITRSRSNPQDYWVHRPCPSSGISYANTNPYMKSRFDFDVVDQLSDTKFKALAKARDMKVNLAVAFAEGNKTVKMIVGTAHTLGKAYGHFRKGRFGKAAKVLGIKRPPKTAAQNWLAYIYGWLPLVSDIQGSAEKLAQEFEVPRSVQLTVRTKSERVYKFAKEITGVISTAKAMHRGKDTVVTRAGLYLRITSQGDQFAASIGFGGIGDLALVAWELIPFSFVFDWIAKVGQYIESISALSGITVLAGWQQTEITRKAVIYGVDSPLWTTTPYHYPYEKRVFTRLPWDGSTPTWPVFRGLRGIDATKVTTVAALYQQLFRGDEPIGKLRPPWLYGHVPWFRGRLPG